MQHADAVVHCAGEGFFREHTPSGSIPGADFVFINGQIFGFIQKTVYIRMPIDPIHTPPIIFLAFVHRKDACHNYLKTTERGIFGGVVSAC
jgi:hypothetical protein